MERKFRITTKERQTDKGAKFLVHSAYINNQWYKVKFNQECTNVPKDRGFYYVITDDKELNLQRKKYTKKDGTEGTELIMWVHQCALEPVSQEEMDEYRQNLMNSVFGNISDIQKGMKEYSADEQLPF